MHAIPTLPKVAPFPGLLADLATELRNGQCCLVTADKGWMLPLYYDLREWLRSVERQCVYIDGRPTDANQPDEVGVMLTAITHLRRVVRGPVTGVVVILPHVDVMASVASGWTNISRELVPLLYENPEVVLLGCCDPTLPLLPVIDKLFSRRYTVDVPFRVGTPVPPEPPPS